MPTGSSSDSGAARDPKWAALLVGAAVATSAMAIAISRTLQPSAAAHAQIFSFLFARDEPAAAWLSFAIAVFSIASARFFSHRDRLVVRLNEDPRAFILGITLVLGGAAIFVYRGHPLSMDEYAPVFQSQVFARGRLTGQIPEELLPRLIPTRPWFLMSSPTGQMISMYWPGFAILLTPFSRLGTPWLLNPLIGGLTLFALWHLARKLWPDSSAAGWTVLLAAASPALTVNAISFYSMPAHLLASTVFALLLSDPFPKRLLLAGLLGSFALVLHNPLPHALFAAPWIVWLVIRPGRIKNLTILAIGYLPFTLLLGFGWVHLEAVLQIQVTGAAAAPRAQGIIAQLSALSFSLPSFDGLFSRAMGLIELGLWAVPFLLPLACIAAVKFVRELFPRLLLFSALSTLFAYFFVSFDQGHGWGYRYFHSAWLVIPLFAGALLATPAQGWARGLMLPAAILSCVFGTGLRFYQVSTFMNAQLAQIPSPPNPNGEFEVVFVHMNRGFYTVDLAQDDPFLDNGRWMLLSEGDAADARFMEEKFKGSYLAAQTEIASVWRVHPAATP